MFYTLRAKFEKHTFLINLIYALLFGTFSLVMGELKFAVPGIEGAQTDFREIPLLISILYIKNPVYLIIACLITSIPIQPDGDYLITFTTTFVMHIIPVVASWFFYNKFSTIFQVHFKKALVWVFFVFLYYGLFLVPAMIYMDLLLGLSSMRFIESYTIILNSWKLEIVSTALITGLYLIQFETRKKLQDHKINLENLVSERTGELASANERLRAMNDELVSSSHEIKSMNENLDGIVKKRSKKIEEQLSLLVRYAHMNSHEVRAPLARILGLLHIIEIEKTNVEQEEVISKLCESGEELDEIVRSMNRLLEKEIDTDETS